MALTTIDFTTGASTLPDVGTLSYNGCLFSPLFATDVAGVAVKDDAGRTVKMMEYTITADGYVTLPAGAEDISPTMSNLRRMLTAQGGHLIYKGRGMDLIINPPGGAGLRDVAWGPTPEVLEFQPMGAGRSAKVKWQIKTRIPEIKAGFGDSATGDSATPGSLLGGGVGASTGRGGLSSIPMLQFNYETVVSYGEDGYSTLTIRGILEIPMTRGPSQTTRSLTATADDLRREIQRRVMSGIDLTRFRITKREFPLSRDKRTLTWDIMAEEKPYMDLPVGCNVARGTYSVRPAKAGMGLCMWLCTLRCSYTVRADYPRRAAWISFLALLRLRMKQSAFGNIPTVVAGAEAPVRPPTTVEGFALEHTSRGPPNPLQLVLDLGRMYLGREVAARGRPAPRPDDGRRAWLIDFNIDEGMYLDSKTVSFSATWRLATTFSHILLASGVWRKVPEKDAAGVNLWATHMRDISGSQSWLKNKQNAGLDVIVDFGGG